MSINFWIRLKERKKGQKKKEKKGQIYLFFKGDRF